jgi:hypothetical protein
LVLFQPEAAPVPKTAQFAVTVCFGCFFGAADQVVRNYIGFFTPNYDLIFNLADLAYISGTLLVLLGVAREVLWMLERIRKTRVPGN